MRISKIFIFILALAFLNISYGQKPIDTTIRFINNFPKYITGTKLFKVNITINNKEKKPKFLKIYKGEILTPMDLKDSAQDLVVCDITYNNITNYSIEFDENYWYIKYSNDINMEIICHCKEYGKHIPLGKLYVPSEIETINIDSICKNQISTWTTYDSNDGLINDSIVFECSGSPIYNESNAIVYRRALEDGIRDYFVNNPKDYNITDIDNLKKLSKVFIDDVTDDGVFSEIIFFSPDGDIDKFKIKVKSILSRNIANNIYKIEFIGQIIAL